jgi:Arm DNA-binding domain
MSHGVVCRQKAKQATQDRRHVPLTDAGIRGLETPAKRMQVADGGGLSLDLHSSGKKSWLYRYRLNGQYGRVTLGRYPDLSLKAARKRRDELAGQVATGHDPARRKRSERLGFAQDSTVEEFGERYYAEQVVPTWKSPMHIRRYLDNDVFPVLGRKPLSTVTALDVQAIVYRKRDQGRIPSAVQLRGVVKRMASTTASTLPLASYRQ